MYIVFRMLGSAGLHIKIMVVFDLNLTCWAVIGAVRQWMGCVTVSECSVGDCFGVGHFIQCWAVCDCVCRIWGSIGKFWAVWD